MAVKRHRLYLPRNLRYRGMSLLELVLALALSVVLLGLMGNAIYFHLNTFQSRQDGVEQSLLARAILRQMGDDLRSAVAYRPVDLKGIDAVAQDSSQLTAAAGAAGVSLPTSNSKTGNTSPKPQGANPAANQASESEPAEPEAAESYQAGFYGDPFSLQFDMTRLPRLDEYDPLFAADGSGDVLRIPADMRTISYHLQGETTVERSSAVPGGIKPIAALPLIDPAQARGLMRSEQERSLAAAGVVTVAKNDANDSEQLLADEVTRLEFRYFDGYEWWPDWDSDQRGGLPMAVEIVVGLANAAKPTSATTSYTPALSTPAASTSGANETLYRLVVRIPTAHPLAMQEEAPLESESTSSGSTEKTSGNSSEKSGAKSTSGAKAGGGS